MARRKSYCPAVCEALEERVVLSSSALITALRLGAHAPVTVGALGDSYTDEYRFYKPDQSQARNWVEILADTNRANFGKFSVASRGEPRNQGFANNWARYDATSSQMIANQLPGLAAQVATGKIRYASIFVGGNDFLYFLRNSQTASASQAPQLLAELAQTETQLATNFTTAVDTLLAANPNVKLVVATLPDVSILPAVQQGEAGNPAAEALVTATGGAIQQYNALIRSVAASNPRIALFDLATTAQELEQTPGGTAPFGGTTIDLTTPGDDYHHFFLADGIHIGTVAQGVIADGFVNAIDTHFGANVKPLSPTQIVQFAAHVRKNQH